MSTPHLVRYRYAEGEFPELITNLLDLSEGGMQFSVRSKMRLGTLLNVIINLVEKNEDVPVLAKVRWVKPIPSRARAYRIGASFEKILSEHRLMLQSTILEKRHSRR